MLPFARRRHAVRISSVLVRPSAPPVAGPTDAEGFYDPVGYLIDTPKMFAYARETLGDTVELVHDTHERLSPAQTVQLAQVRLAGPGCAHLLSPQSAL